MKAAKQVLQSSLLAEGRDKDDAPLDVTWTEFQGSGNRTYRYGARAFFTLKGYASRNRETELAFQVETYSHRPGSRLRWEEDRREAATWASV